MRCSIMKIVLLLFALLGAAIGVTAQSMAYATPAVQASDSAPAVFAEAQRLSQQGKFDEAIAKLQVLKTQSPLPKGLEHEIGIAYYKKGDYQAASAAFEGALKENPSDSEATQLLGLSYYLAGKPQQAIPYLEKVQTWFPRANVDGSYILGICYIQSKRYDDARHAFGKMFDVPPDSASSYLFTARMLLRQEYDPIAEEYALKATTLDPKLPGAHFLLGELHLYKSRIPDAISDFQQELALNPSYAPAYYKLADAYLRVQKYDDAEKLLQRSIWLDSTSTGPYILMGKVLQKKGETALAVRALQRAVAMDPNNPMTHQLLGQAYRELGQDQQAQHELQLVQQLNAAKEASR
ncbi:MAG: tetratricopeptide repeat protein [Acidobacteriaceae bacterium]